MNPHNTLLIFRLHNFTNQGDWNWDLSKPVNCPDKWSAIAVSGGKQDFYESMEVFQRFTGGKVPGPSPFLSSAPEWLILKVIWSLLGPGGRLYPILTTSGKNLDELNVDTSGLPEKVWDVLVSLAFDTKKAAELVPWTDQFFTSWSKGLALGFWGNHSKLETRLHRELGVISTFDMNKGIQDAKEIKKREQDAHPFLHASLEESGFDWLLDNAQVILKPGGWEGMDALFITKEMSQDEMITAIHKELGAEVEILEFDGDDIYLDWIRKRTLPI